MTRPYLLLIFLLTFTPTVITAQDYDDADTHRFELLLRAKALGFVIIEDVWVRSFSIGLETRFKERFSFTADAVHFQWRYEEEVSVSPGSQNYNEYSQWDPRNYVAFEARYYPKIDFKTVDAKMYLSCFSKFGTRAIRTHELYPPMEGEVIRLHSDFHDIGPAIGVQLGKRFGLDVNMGAAYRQEVKSEEIYHDNAPLTYTYNVWDRKWIYNIRVNFFLNFTEL